MKSISRATIGLTSSVSVLGVVLLAVLVYCCIHFWQAKQQEETANRALHAVEHLLLKPTSEYSPEDVKHGLEEVLGGQGRTQARVVDSRGNRMFGPEVFFNGEGSVREFSQVFETELPQLQAKRVELAVSTVDDERFLNFISGIFASSIVLWILVSVLISMRLIRLVLRPINRLTERIHNLGPRSLDVVLDDQKAPLELRPFIDGFNRLLGQLRENREQLKLFNSNVAHELNTPLSSLTISHELLQRRKLIEGEDLQKIVGDHLDELDRMARIIRSMLFLANANQGRELQLQSVPSLRQLVVSVAEYLEQLAEDRDLRITVKSDATVEAETELIKRAVSNLLSNAIRYAQANTEITVHITREAERVWIKVSNEGPTIDPVKLNRLFEPFFRAEEGRSDTGSNHGLGLAIVAAIAKLHGGDVFASSENQVTVIGFSVHTKRQSTPVGHT
mgnify:CR=1 FL=1